MVTPATKGVWKPVDIAQNKPVRRRVKRIGVKNEFGQV